MKRKTVITILLVIVAALIILFGLLGVGGANPLLVRSGIIRVESYVDYVALPFDQLVKESDVIVVGKVVELTPLRWNQDNGEYWANGFQYHLVRIEASQFIVDKIGAANQQVVEIMVGGMSIAEGNGDYSLKVGDEVIAFAEQVDLAWKGGTKSMLEISTAPSAAFFRRLNPSGNFVGVIVNKAWQSQKSMSLSEWIAKIEETLEETPSP